MVFTGKKITEGFDKNVPSYIGDNLSGFEDKDMLIAIMLFVFDRPRTTGDIMQRFNLSVEQAEMLKDVKISDRYLFVNPTEREESRSMKRIFTRPDEIVYYCWRLTACGQSLAYSFKEMFKLELPNGEEKVDGEEPSTG